MMRWGERGAVMCRGRGRVIYIVRCGPALKTTDNEEEKVVE